jgi:hypothetical protein
MMAVKIPSYALQSHITGQPAERIQKNKNAYLTQYAESRQQSK